ncbi:alpha-L-rhamnosidase [Paenibacillus sp. 32O-W]|uniref:DUF5605 domain-containing protein n=1 Tax=Paenibacillus sp. 32O-W TaxID=1695218 RepID=UPI00071EA90B|nr:DUF5605 domain-containing protein [Paenibacillus sp. 32O-W]ALS28567.1 alpha-L-rhamnosidase [Paenibacillus sp. 32O-W]
MNEWLTDAYQIEQWTRFELRLQGPASGNPYRDIRLAAHFRHRNRVLEVDGFYDGDGQYCVRFMPDTQGIWTFETISNAPELNGIKGTLNCTEPAPGNHGPVCVDRIYHFAYADGTPFYPVGTTAYVWHHQGEELENQTLNSLANSPFNKIRMCVFPKHYDYNHKEPAFYPFQGSPEEGWDFDSFNPAFWRHLERRIQDLLDLGIEADLILFHPYDRWGFASMSAETDDFYLRYAIARLSSFRNIWWSLANEYDLMSSKSSKDWDRFFRILLECDPYQHLRSIHNWHNPEIHYRSNLHWYDHGKPWVTHASIQHHDLKFVREWRELYRKPIVVDECRYEGDMNHGWGNITAERMTECFWEGFTQGGYVTHGETYLHSDDVIWWSHGGTLRGDSPGRIRFLRKLMEEGPRLDTSSINFKWDAFVGCAEGEYYLVYFGASRPSYRVLPLPEGNRYTIDLIDTWEMTVTRLEGEYGHNSRVNLPAKPYQALRIMKLNEGEEKA